jgi:rhamnose transport system permease protein
VSAVPATPAKRRPGFAVGGLLRWETLLVALLLGVIALGAATSPVFLRGSNFSLLASGTMEKAIMALPMTLIVVAAEIDLSVASTLGLASAVVGVGWAAGVPLWLCVVGALLVGALCGAVNGLLVTRLGLPSLVVTLGTLALYRGLASVLLGAEAVSDYPDWFTGFGFGTIPGTGVPWTFLLFVALLAVFLVVLHRSWVGRQLYAVGLNPEAARFSAVRVARLTFWLFVASGTLAALAGVVFTARISSSRADNAVGFELDVVAAVLLGGVSIFGGRGTLVGVVLSLATIATVRNVLALNNVGAEIQNITIGALLILSVLGPNLARRLPRRRRARAAPEGS